MVDGQRRKLFSPAGIHGAKKHAGAGAREAAEFAIVGAESETVRMNSLKHLSTAKELESDTPRNTLTAAVGMVRSETLRRP